jgi:hypothetical protein
MYMNESSFGFEQVAKKEKELTLEQAEGMMRERIIERLNTFNPPTYAAFAAVLNDQGMPLLFERKREGKPHTGTFSIVGGGIDLSHMNDPYVGTEISARMQEDGLERPTDALIREIDEELYGGQLLKAGRLKTDQLEEEFAPKRFAIVYDAVHNAYNLLFTIQVLRDTPFQIKADEVGAMKELQDTDPAEMNPMTRYALRSIGKMDAGDDNIISGPIKHIILPKYVYRYFGQLQDKERKTPAELDLGEELHEPAYLISY